MSETSKKACEGTILVVDDDEDFRLQTRLQLESAGYRVIEAETPAEGRKILEEAQPDLAIVDLMMDEMDAGFTLCYQIKKKFPGMPVILATGVAGETGLEFDATTDEERSWVKADVVLNKPMRFEQLIGEIKRLLGVGR